MAIIALERMKFFAYHGYYEEEQILGNQFELDVMVNANTMTASMVDDLYQSFPGAEEHARPTTVNYETIYLLCQMEMRKPTRLLESLVDRIASRIEGHFSNVSGVMVRLRKLHPPLGGRVGCAWVMTKRGNMDTSGMGGMKGFGGFDGFPDL